MPEIVPVRFTIIDDDITQHIDRVERLVEKLEGMNTNLETELVIGILTESIYVEELKSTTAAMKNISDDKLKWEDVTERLIK